jgi:hypothetical protein
VQISNQSRVSPSIGLGGSIPTELHLIRNVIKESLSELSFSGIPSFFPPSREERRLLVSMGADGNEVLVVLVVGIELLLLIIILSSSSTIK